MKKGIIISIILIMIDQISKILAVNFLKGTEGIPIIEGVFRLYYLENRGAAFGIFQGQQIFLLITTVLLSMLIAYTYYTVANNPKYTGLSYCLIFIFSGAIGNLIDRLYHQFVVDFFYFELIDFAVFTIADSYITVAVAVLFILLIFKYSEEDIDYLFRKFKRSKKEK